MCAKKRQHEKDEGDQCRHPDAGFQSRPCAVRRHPRRLHQQRVGQGRLRRQPAQEGRREACAAVSLSRGSRSASRPPSVASISQRTEVPWSVGCSCSRMLPTAELAAPGWLANASRQPCGGSSSATVTLPTRRIAAAPPPMRMRTVTKPAVTAGGKLLAAGQAAPDDGDVGQRRPRYDTRQDIENGVPRRCA